MDTAPQVELNPIQVMEQRFEILEQIAIIQGRQSAELAPLLEAVRLSELFIKDQMNKDGSQQIKSALTGDSCNFTTKSSVTVKNMDSVIGYVVAASPPPEALGLDVVEKWPAILAHLQSTGLWALFNQAVNKTTVKEIIKDTNATPPGVEYSEFKDLAWKKGKGKPGAVTVPA